MNQERFDDLIRAFVSDEVSRARMLKLLGKALLASTLGGFGLMSVNDDAEAKPKTCKKDSQCTVAGQVCCGGQCTVLSTLANCSGCGDVCGAGEACCDGNCTALNTLANCSACGDACGPCQKCVDGQCRNCDGCETCGEDGRCVTRDCGLAAACCVMPDGSGVCRPSCLGPGVECPPGTTCVRGTCPAPDICQVAGVT
jgi:hypothetical protein